MMSSGCSMPTERRTRFSFTPRRSRREGESSLWEEVAGWMARV